MVNPEAFKRRVTEARIEELRAACGLGALKCRKALERNGADVGRALGALIDSGEVEVDDLNPDTVSDELFGRASQRQLEAVLYKGFNKAAKQSASYLKLLSKDLQEIVATEIRELAEQRKPKQLAATGAATKFMARIKRRREALEKNPIVVSLPPLPKLTLTLNEWIGTDILKTWAGFGKRRGSKGKVTISIPRAPKDEDDAKPVPPAPEMVAAYAHLKAHEAQMRSAVLKAVQSHINDTLNGKYGWDLQPVDDEKVLKTMMEIGSVHPLTVAKKGMSYLGLFFQCTWDEEHAAGVLLHGSRVIKVGDNEAASDIWAALDDGGKVLRGWHQRPRAHR